jgi:rare lipoprotein A (peptidoglycan hydrolase)
MSVLVVPILLLAAPGGAASHARTAHGPGAAGARRAAGPDGAVSAPVTPRWSDPRVVVADYIRPATSTTTTTTAPPPVQTVHVAAVTTVPPTTAPPTTVPPTTTTTAPPPPPPPAHAETGQASWYQAPAGTCASPDIAYGTVVTVTDVSTGKSVTCTVDDHMDASSGRVLDMAEATFAELADPSVGVIEVRVSW